MNHPITGRVTFIQDGISIEIGFSKTYPISQIITYLCNTYSIKPQQIVSITMRNRKAIKAQKEEALRNYNLTRGAKSER